MIKRTLNVYLSFPILLSLCCVLTFANVYAQTDCGVVKLDEAKKQYATGHFDEVITLLTPCLNNGFNDQEKLQAYKLLAITKIATDSLDQANNYTILLLEINPVYEPEIFDPPRFVRMIDDLKQQSQGVLVTSVSKKAENVLKAPATVSIITDEDIDKRGYTDVEQVFHDMSGFDISLGRSANYSNLYQRGYRSVSTDRTLLLVDGIEQNDLVSNNAIISRQYPMSNIKRIEVIYGPASTMYGSNAYAGVINIVTKANYEMLGEGKNFGVNVQTNYGSYATKNIDATITARSKDISVSIAGRYYDSNELDIDNIGTYKFDIDNINYAKVLNVTGTNAGGQYLADAYITANKLKPDANATPRYVIGANNSSLTLTDAGLQAIKAMDAATLTAHYPLGINNFNRVWYLRAKAQITGGFTFGFETFRTNESLPEWYTSSTYVFTTDPRSNRWVNWNSNIFLTYDKRLGSNLSLSNLTSYRLHAIDGATNFQTYEGYYNGTYSFAALSANKQPHLDTTYYYRSSNQIENETKLLWNTLKDLDIVNGLDFRSSLIQIDYAKSRNQYPEETGTIGTSGILGSNYFRIINLGFYSQGTYHLNKTLNLILGGRLDNNHIRQNGGFGTVFNYRIGTVYSPGRFIFKAIYATAFEDPSAFQKYATISSRLLAAPNLQPEHVKNLDLSTYWQAAKDLSVNVVAYNARYTFVVGTAIVPYNNTTTGQFQNLGSQEITGVQAEVKYTVKQYALWANYTYTNPIDKATNLRISDIASSNANLGITGTYFKKFQATLISNYTGKRVTGLGTSGSTNPMTSFPPVTIFNINLGYKDLFKGATLQFKVANILDKQYFDPGVRDASGVYSSALPQQGRTYNIKVRYNL